MKHTTYLLLLSICLYGDTLEQLIHYALNNAPALQQTQAQMSRLELQHDKSRAARYGTFNLVADYTHYNTERTLAPLSPNAIGSGAPITTTKDLFSAGVQYSVPLFTGFSQTRQIEITALGKEIARTSVLLSREQIVYNIRSLYLSILSFQELYHAQQRYTQALRKLSEQIAYEVELGRKAPLDLLKARADLYASQTQEAQLQSNIDIAKASLGAVVGKTVTAVESLVFEVTEPSYNVNTLYAAAALLSKIELEEFRIQQAKKRQEQTASSQLPQLGFNAYYGKNYGEEIRLNRWDNETLWQAGVHASYTLRDFGINSIQIQEAAVATLEASLHKKQTFLDLKKLITQAVANVTQSYHAYLGSLTQMQLNRESEHIEQVRYDNGAATLNDLLLAKGKYYLALAKVIEYKYRYQNNIYYIDYVMEQGAPR